MPTAFEEAGGNERPFAIDQPVVEFPSKWANQEYLRAGGEVELELELELPDEN